MLIRNEGFNGLQPMETTTSTVAHLSLSAAEDSYVGLYPELSIPQVNSDLDGLDSVSLPRPPKTEDNDLSEEGSCFLCT